MSCGVGKAGAMRSRKVLMRGEIPDFWLFFGRLLGEVAMGEVMLLFVGVMFDEAEV